MYTLSEIDDEFNRLDHLAKRAGNELIQSLGVEGQDLRVDRQYDLIKLAREQRCLLQIIEGSAAYRVQGKTLFFLNEGDLCGQEQLSEELKPTLVSDFAVVARAYPLDEAKRLRRVLSNDSQHFEIWSEPLLQFLVLRHYTICSVLRDTLKDEVSIAPDFRSYRAGDLIIEEGAQDTDVYTLVEGQAEVSIGGVEVGEIQHDEIFGMIAAITGTPRSATVRARGAATVLVVPKEQFLDLITNRPIAVLKLIEDMARVILSLNQTVVEAAGMRKLGQGRRNIMV